MTNMINDQHPELVSVKFESIQFDAGLYPREHGHDPETVQIYARDMEQIEAAGKYISINATGALLDGRHRHLAYKKRADGNTDFNVTVWRYAIESPLESFRLACKLQDRGRALTTGDRIASAKRLYSLGDQLNKDIAAALGVSESTISDWLSRTRKDEKKQKKDAAYSMWLSCATQEEIAEAVGVDKGTVTRWNDEFLQTSESVERNNSPDFTPPIYNVWSRTKKTNKVDHFGNSEPTFVDNLLYLYTDPADIVVDPFAGSGSTIDVCKKRGRRYYVSDRKPIVEREHEIRQHDLTEGMPAIPRWKDVKLVYLDPPYWLQAQGQYSDDPTDLGNMSLEEFNKQLAAIITAFARKLKNGAPRYIALIIQPTQWKAPDRQYTDHVGDMLRAVKLPVDMRFSAPYQTEQYTPQMVEWAKANKRCLVLTREIVVWRVGQ